jgi:hypothetical protein
LALVGCEIALDLGLAVGDSVADDRSLDNLPVEDYGQYLALVLAQ